MDQSEVQKIVEENLERLKNKLGLETWDIRFTYGDCDGDQAATMCDIDYKIADVRLDPVYMDDEAKVLRTLKHELIHCIVSTFGTYRQAVSCFLTEKERDAVGVMFRRAEEEITCAFVRILEKTENGK